jgi:hypothetical protein
VLTAFTLCTWIPSTIHHVSVGSHPPQVSLVFNNASFINANNGIEEAVDRVIQMVKDPLKWKEATATPPVSDEGMKRFFSWHPAVWPKYGDGLRQRIINEILSMCNAVADDEAASSTAGR